MQDNTIRYHLITQKWFERRNYDYFNLNSETVRTPTLEINPECSNRRFSDMKRNVSISSNPKVQEQRVRRKLKRMMGQSFNTTDVKSYYFQKPYPWDNIPFEDFIKPPRRIPYHKFDSTVYIKKIKPAFITNDIRNTWEGSCIKPNSNSFRKF